MNTSTSEVIAVVIAQPTFISQESFHSHVDSYFGTYIDHCELKTPGVVGSSTREDNLGNFKTFNLIHRCSSPDDSTTQWWLGVQYVTRKKILYRHIVFIHRGQGFESRTSLNVFRLSFRNCKSCVYNCDDPLSYN